VSKHQKTYPKPAITSVPFRGQKNPSAEHRFLLGISDSSFEGTQNIKHAPFVNWLLPAACLLSRNKRSLNLSDRSNHARNFLIIF
jgi:hypothetical protein